MDRINIQSEQPIYFCLNSVVTVYSTYDNYVTICLVLFCCDLILDNFTNILRDYFTSTRVITWLPQYQWNNQKMYG